MHMLNIQIILNWPIIDTFHFDETLFISFIFLFLCSLSSLESDGSERQVLKPLKSLYIVA